MMPYVQRDPKLESWYPAIKARQRVSYARAKSKREAIPTGRPAWKDVDAPLRLHLCASVVEWLEGAR